MRRRWLGSNVGEGERVETTGDGRGPQPAARIRARILSPELALVDEELAAWARVRLNREAAAAEAESKPVPASPESPFALGEPLARLGEADRSELRSTRRRLSFPFGIVCVALLVGAAVYEATPAGRHHGDHRSSVTAPARSVARGRDTPPRSRARSAPPKTTHRSATAVVLTWPTARRSRSYTVNLFRRSTTIFREVGLRTGRLSLPSTWLYRGHRFRLSPGIYHWQVRATLGDPRRRGGSQLVLFAPLVIRPP
jgi:hypothetical protein